MRIKLSESEKLMEERRLSSENELERIRIAMQNLTAIPKEEGKSNPIVINNIMPKRSKRRGKVVTDEMGNPSIELEDYDEENEGTEGPQD
jgi:hypothetical protein